MLKEWTYSEAFSRMRGLVTENEAEKIRQVRIGIVGSGGVGGVHLITLARLGFERFIISDPDTFAVANFNRQYGADLKTLGRNKAQVMAEKIRDINPQADVEIFPAVTVENAATFVARSDLLVDGIDAFEIKLRRLLFRSAYDKGIYAMSFGPFGFSTGWVIFDPKGLSADRYFQFSEVQTSADPTSATNASLKNAAIKTNDIKNFARFILGMCPSGTQARYMDYNFVNVKMRTGPSVASACHLASGVMGAEVIKAVLGRGKIYAAPWYHQFDPYLNIYHRHYLWFGNAHPLQVIKRWVLCSRLSKMEFST